ncbi:MAG: hypothetical protein FWH05_09550, partial [Oscillospiraceae bacterium]|nr:hypothetical protein [Oscillospiraceae bacterium]
RDIEYWLSLIGADTEEEINALEKSSNDKIRKAVGEVRRLNKDKTFVREVEAREVQLREEKSALYSAEKKGREEGKKIGEKIGMEKGREEGIQETIEKLRQGGMSDEEINKYLH